MLTKVYDRIRLTLALKQRYLALFLLAMALAVASAERSALSVASPSLSADLQLSPIELGWLLSAFAWSYVIAHLPVGLVVEHYGTRRTIGLGILLSAVVSLIIALAGAPSFANIALVLIFAGRIALGIVQAPLGSSSGIVISAWFPQTERGIAGSIFSSMPLVAVATMNPVMGYITDHSGWQVMFLTLAAVGALATLLWFAEFQLPLNSRRLRAEEREKIEHGGALVNSRANRGNNEYVRSQMPFTRQLLAIFGNRMMGAFLIAQYAVTAITWFFLAWYPSYLVQTYGLSVAEAAAASAPPAIAGFVGGLCVGFFSDYVLKRTGSMTLSRKLPIYIGMTMVAVVFVVAPGVDDASVITVLMSVAFFGKGFATLGWTIISEIAPANKIGVTGSIINATGNASGIFTPIAIGYLVAHAGNFDMAMYFMAAHGAVAIFCHAVLVGKLRRLDPI